MFYFILELWQCFEYGLMTGDWKERWPTLVFHYSSVCSKPGKWAVMCLCVRSLLDFETVPTVWYFCFSFYHGWEIELSKSSECSLCGTHGDINVKSEVSRRDWQGPKWRVIMNRTNNQVWERLNVFLWYKLMTVCSLN